MKKSNNKLLNQNVGLSDAEHFDEVVAGENILINFKKLVGQEYDCHIRTAIDSHDFRSKQPDILIVEPMITSKKRGKGSYTTKIVIEIDDSSNKAATLRKVQQMIKDYKLLEGFVYIINKKEWYKFDSKAKIQTNNTSYSDVLKVNFNDLIL